MAGDDVALLTGVRLDANGVGFDGDGFLSAAYLHLEVDTIAVTDLKDEALLFGNLESGRFRLDVVVTDLQFREDVYWPESLLTTVCDETGFVLVTVILTLGIAAPEGSVTVPTMVAFCAMTDEERQRNTSSKNYKIKRTDVSESIKALEHP